MNLAASQTTKPADLGPAIIVIFGITGDLAQRYILPALYHLFKDDLLHSQTEIIGITRSSLTAEELLDRVELCVNEIDQICDPVALKKMHDKLSMHHMDVTNASDYDTLHDHLDSIEDKNGVCMNRLYYLSIPPQVFGPIIRFLGEHDLNASCKHGVARTRLLLEKPFGYDHASAKELIIAIGQQFSEDQVFRIDHYLAKEIVQNILTFRFFNPIFKPLWNNQNIKGITITASEKLGIERRVSFYDNTGALRDVLQNHLLQLLALITMEQPPTLNSDDIRNTKSGLLESVSPIQPDEIDKYALRAQYQGYREEVDNPHSTTETFVALQLQIDSPRWRGVPIRLITGKGLQEKRTDIWVDFQPDENGNQNRLCFRLQPDEGIELELHVKKPGFEQKLEKTTMDFSYQRTFSTQSHPSAYERVLVDAVRGDHTLFATAEEVLASWRIIQAVIERWATVQHPLVTYRKGATVQEVLNSFNDA